MREWLGGKLWVDGRMSLACGHVHVIKGTGQTDNHTNIGPNIEIATTFEWLSL